MAKVILGNRPKNFKRTVSFPMHDGTTGTIECTYKYRTRTEFGAFIDKIMAAARATDAAKGPADQPAGEFSMSDLMAKTAGSNAEYIVDVLDAWSLDEPLGLDAAQQLADELPAAATAIMDTYRAAIVDGRLGN